MSEVPLKAIREIHERSKPHKGTELETSDKKAGRMTLEQLRDYTSSARASLKVPKGAFTNDELAALVKDHGFEVVDRGEESKMLLLRRGTASREKFVALLSGIHLLELLEKFDEQNLGELRKLA